MSFRQSKHGKELKSNSIRVIKTLNVSTSMTNESLFINQILYGGTDAPKM